MAGAGSIGSTMPRRELGRRLLKLRNDAGLTRHTAAKKLEWSEPKVWRIETGQIALRTHDVELMCRIYGADEETTVALVALAPETRTKDWWRVYAEAIPQGLDLLFGLELGASEFRWWEPQLVPGVLQTERYARTVVQGDGSLTSDEIELRVRARLDRQSLLFNRVDPPRFSFVIDEDALNRPVGPDMMREQLHRLDELSSGPEYVSLRVVPRSAGLHEGMAGQFTILDFPTSRSGFGEPTTVYSDGWITPLYYTKSQEVDRYIAAFDHLRVRSLDEEASRELIRQYMGDLT
ncbi:MAG TPA: helix-turn-helix transcriptional regulator [Micromonosporaceae bacterium]